MVDALYLTTKPYMSYPSCTHLKFYNYSISIYINL
ncbi:hypothetical protein TwortDSMZ_041 [Staphylococcus phage Twort]|uniref:Uncharacterized protein n=2 Tax=Staphylococcus phage Twort (strain DSM 17442 / HER 48) TaxID=2908167 RepID=A0A6H0X5K9_BPTWO|nr:ORF404 [Staphylococcus phage Twort]AAX92489.1 ORF404 [Staphylococcus phage Twort]QIW89210.1 hypothetical protein TwortDSMZ_041 [Staphylococcus phage Twort]